MPGFLAFLGFLFLITAVFLVAVVSNEERTKKFLDTKRREIIELGGAGVLPDEIARKMTDEAGFEINGSEIMDMIKQWEEKSVQEAEFRNRCRAALASDDHEVAGDTKSL